METHAVTRVKYFIQLFKIDIRKMVGQTRWDSFVVWAIWTIVSWYNLKPDTCLVSHHSGPPLSSNILLTFSHASASQPWFNSNRNVAFTNRRMSI